MDIPQTKADLLQAMERGRREWDDLLSQISDQDLKTAGVEGIWSIKDILAHICGYEQYMTATLADIKGDQANGSSALDVYYQTTLTIYRKDHPDLPEKIQEVSGDQVNAVFVAACRYKQPGEVRTLEQQAYQKLRKSLDAFSDPELSRPFTAGGKNLFQIVPQQCYEHYRIHIPAIRDWLRI